MYFTKNIYNVKTLLSMIEIALSEMRENECCFFCTNKEQIESICNNKTLCKSYLFEGLADAAINLEEQKGDNINGAEQRPKTDYGMPE